MTDTAQDPFDLVVYIGRFQGPHLGHQAILMDALALAPQVAVVLGSAFQARTPKNPFTWQERSDMIRSCVPDAERGRLLFVPVRDYYDDTRWVAAVRASVTDAAPQARRIALIGHFKDESSYYLSRFPGWTLLERPRAADIDASAVRGVLFETPGQARDLIFTRLRELVPPGVHAYLSAWWSLPHAERLVADAAWLRAYRAKWTAPFANAGDAVVVCAGHVLLIQRAEGAGAGLYAVPGGFMEEGQSFYETAVRELKEETNFPVLEVALRDHLKASAVFDHPGRGLRGRIISMAFLFDLGSAPLPEVQSDLDPDKGARRALWVPIDELTGMEDQFFEDHFHILDQFLALT